MSFPVLICDDSSLARKMVRKSLPEPFTEQVYTAENGQQALQLLEQQPICLLFLDLTMPLMDGVEVLQTIKERSLEVFVIVISGDIQPQMQERVLSNEKIKVHFNLLYCINIKLTKRHVHIHFVILSAISYCIFIPVRMFIVGTIPLLKYPFSIAFNAAVCLP